MLYNTDSYKIGHWSDYQPDTQRVYSYFEARKGAAYPYTQFFGLQYLLKKYFVGKVITYEDINRAKTFYEAHFGDASVFNEEGFTTIVEKYEGKLPLEIKAVPEGTIVSIDNVLMTVENTAEDLPWLTNFVETQLTHIWYPTTVATKSLMVKNLLAYYLETTCEDSSALDFMLHDFGCRGATTQEASAIGGAGHLLNFSGTDTIPALMLFKEYYNATEMPGFSVRATEHSVMTSLGDNGDIQVLHQLLENHPTGILSVVADSYDIYKFTDEVCNLKDQILARDGRFVLRPDSVTYIDPTSESLVLTLLEKLASAYPVKKNSKGYYVLDPHIRLLWGDGLNIHSIKDILSTMKEFSFAAENIVFGMGGGLLQTGINRDTQRFAFKCSAQKRNDTWINISKKPLDKSKTSKAGRLSLVKDMNGFFVTVEQIPDSEDDFLETVFLNGELIRDQSLSDIRKISQESFNQFKNSLSKVFEKEEFYKC